MNPPKKNISKLLLSYGAGYVSLLVICNYIWISQVSCKSRVNWQCAKYCKHMRPNLSKIQQTRTVSH